MKKGTVFIIIGLVLLLAAAVFTGYNLWDGQRAASANEELLDSFKEKLSTDYPEVFSDTGAPIEKDPSVDSSVGLITPDREMPSVSLNGYLLIGTLDIPDIDFSSAIISQWSYPNLKVSACRYSGSVYDNSMVICGHDYITCFGKLRQIAPGAEITFTDVEGYVYKYIVSYTETLTPRDIEGMTGISDDWDLTLFTCNLGGQTRFAVRCTLSEE